MNPIEVRPARASEVAAILGLWAVAAENGHRPVDRPEAVRRLIEHDAGALAVAVVDGQLVGSVVSGWDGWRFHLYRLAVHPEFRRHGVGARLLDRAESRLIALGATRIDAMVLDANELGQTLWRARGYRRQDDWRRWVLDRPNTAADRGSDAPSTG